MKLAQERLPKVIMFRFLERLMLCCRMISTSNFFMRLNVHACIHSTDAVASALVEAISSNLHETVATGLVTVLAT
jgi:hypothetical protein